MSHRSFDSQVRAFVRKLPRRARASLARSELEEQANWPSVVAVALLPPLLFYIACGTVVFGVLGRELGSRADRSVIAPFVVGWSLFAVVMMNSIVDARFDPTC